MKKRLNASPIARETLALSWRLTSCCPVSTNRSTSEAAVLHVTSDEQDAASERILLFIMPVNGKDYLFIVT